MSALASPAVDAYLVAAITDELTLAKLLGWAKIESPVVITPNCWIFGTHIAARGHTHRNASVPCPRWRRDWAGAGDLIARLELNMVIGDKRIAVRAGEHDASTEVSIHPNKDDAVRYAICKASIAYLTAKQARGMA